MKFALIAVLATASAITLRDGPAPAKKEGGGSEAAELGLPAPAKAPPAAPKPDSAKDPKAKAAAPKAPAENGMLPKWGERWPPLPVPVVIPANTAVPSTACDPAGPLGPCNGDSASINQVSAKR